MSLESPMSASQRSVISDIEQLGTGIPGLEVPPLDRRMKLVRFILKPDTLDHKLQKEDTQAFWLSRAEMQAINRSARQVCYTVRETNPKHFEAFSRLHQDCSKEDTVQELLSNHKEMLYSCSATSMRGLESRAHLLMRQYRSFHVKSLLEIQQKSKSLVAIGSREQLLRARSIYTSRASRTLARLLAQSDSMEVATIALPELLLPATTI